MNLPQAPQAYARAVWQQILDLIRRADERNHKKDGDVEIGSGRLILRSPNGKRWNITASDAGVLTSTEIT